MDKLKKILNKAEELGWSYSIQKEDDRNYVELQTHSPAGEDFYMDIDFEEDAPGQDFIDNLSNYSFDPDEHAAMYINIRGTNGVPGSIRTLIEDAESIGKKIDELYEECYNAFKNLEKEYAQISINDVILRESGSMGFEYSYSLVKGITADELYQKIKQFVALEPPLSLYEYLEVHGAELIPIYSCCDAYSEEEEVDPVNFFDVEYDADTGITLFSELSPNERIDMLISKARYIEAAFAAHFPQNDNSSSKIVDGVTTCCGYDFGTDADVAKFCPICGKRIFKEIQ